MELLKAVGAGIITIFVENSTNTPTCGDSRRKWSYNVIDDNNNMLVVPLPIFQQRRNKVIIQYSQLQKEKLHSSVPEMRSLFARCTTSSFLVMMETCAHIFIETLNTFAEEKTMQYLYRDSQFGSSLSLCQYNSSTILLSFLQAPESVYIT